MAKKENVGSISNKEIWEGLIARHSSIKDRQDLNKILVRFFYMKLGPRYGLSGFSKKSETDKIKEAKESNNQNADKIIAESEELLKIKPQSPVKQSLVFTVNEKGHRLPIESSQYLLDYLIKIDGMPKAGIIAGDEEGIYEHAIHEYLGESIQRVDIAPEGIKKDNKVDEEPIDSKQLLDIIIDIATTLVRHPSTMGSLAATADNRLDTESVLAVYTGQDELRSMFDKMRYMADKERSYKTHEMEVLKRKLSISKGEELKEGDSWIERISKPSIEVKYTTVENNAWQQIKKAIEHSSSKHTEYFANRKRYKILDGLDFVVIGSNKYAQISTATQPKTDTIINIGQYKFENGRHLVRYVGDLKFSLKKDKYIGIEGGAILKDKGEYITKVIGSKEGNIFLRAAIDFAPKGFKVASSGSVGTIGLGASHGEGHIKVTMGTFLSKYVFETKQKKTIPQLREIAEKNVHKITSQEKLMINRAFRFFKSIYGGIADSYVNEARKSYVDWEANVFFKYKGEFKTFEDLVKGFKIIPADSPDDQNLEIKCNFIKEVLQEIEASNIKVIITYTPTNYRLPDQEKQKNKDIDIPAGQIWYYPKASTYIGGSNRTGDGRLFWVSKKNNTITGIRPMMLKPGDEVIKDKKEIGDKLLKKFETRKTSLENNGKVCYFKGHKFYIMRDDNTTYVLAMRDENWKTRTDNVNNSYY